MQAGTVFVGLLPVFALASDGGTSIRRFDFGAAEPAPGWIAVTPEMHYTAARGFGFETGAVVALATAASKSGPDSDACTSNEPFFFSVDLPPGNYRVTVTVGNPAAATSTVVKAESRRLVLPPLDAPAGRTDTASCLVNIRTAKLPDGGQVRLKPREIGALHWDPRLTLEFNGEQPSPAAVIIEPEEHAPTVFLAGDSTVTDQQLEPWAAWGQMLPQFFSPTVAIANHAESGETIKSFVGERRWAKILSQLRSGDFVFLQFGHNDQKQNAEHTEAATGFKDYLRSFIADTRTRGAFPVLVTSMERRNFNPAGHIVPSLEGYPTAMRETGRELGVPVIDLNAMSIRFYEALGAEGAKTAFVHFPAGSFPGQDNALADDTHFSTYGADQLARCVAEGIKLNVPALAAHLRPGMAPYDPAHPQPFSDWKLPASPPKPLAPPEGS